MDTDNQYYQALLSRDTRFDGRFFVGVKSTGIYCRPVCRVKAPLQKNCLFFHSAAKAQSQGFRPCLRCRPEQAPGLSYTDSSYTLARQAIQLIHSSQFHRVDVLAKKIGISERHLHRIFTQSFGVAPKHYLQTQQLLQAKTLLMDTQLPLIQIAQIIGFKSQSQFYAQFKHQYNMTPSQLRNKKHKKKHKKPINLTNNLTSDLTSDLTEHLTFKLSYRPPFDWTSLLQYLSKRRIAHVELIENDQYMRTVKLLDQRGKSHQGWIRVSDSPQKRHHIIVEVSVSLTTVIPQVLVRVQHMFDLHAEPEKIAETLKELSTAKPGLRIPGSWDGFELALRAVLGQQITISAATTLLTRVATLCHSHIQTPTPELSLTTPSASEFLHLDDQQLGEIGIIRQRIYALKEIATLIDNGHLELTPYAEPQKTIDTLQKIKGIGPWTANYIAMRALHWPDAFVADDYGVKKALNLLGMKNTQAAKKAEQLSQSWRPWRSYAVMQLWRQLN